jgi:hypothetical protein
MVMAMPHERARLAVLAELIGRYPDGGWYQPW